MVSVAAIMSQEPSQLAASTDLKREKKALSRSAVGLNERRCHRGEAHGFHTLGLMSCSDVTLAQTTSIWHLGDRAQSQSLLTF